MKLQQVLTDRYNTGSVPYLYVCRARDGHVETRAEPEGDRGLVAM
jgi:hypothetical protein